MKWVRKFCVHSGRGQQEPGSGDRHEVTGMDEAKKESSGLVEEQGMGRGGRELPGPGTCEDAVS